MNVPVALGLDAEVYTIQTVVTDYDPIKTLKSAEGGMVSISSSTYPDLPTGNYYLQAVHTQQIRKSIWKVRIEMFGVY